MTSASRHRRLVAPLVAGALLLFGEECPDVLHIEGPPAAVDLELVQIIPFGAGYYAEVEIHATTIEPFQAFDLDLSWDPAVVIWAAAFPHADFDDDGSLFGKPVVTGGDKLVQIVDYRRGAPASGDTNLATVFLYSPIGGTTQVKTDGTIAGPDGGVFDIVFNTPTIVFESP